MSVCFPLKGSAACSDFQGFSAWIGTGSFDNTIAGFDAFVVSQTDVNGGFGGAFTGNVYGCSGWDKTGLRYTQATYCAYLVYSAFTNSDPTTGNPCNSASLGNMPLCASSMAAFIASFQTIMSNKAFCPNGQNDAAKGYITAYQGIMNLASPPSCAVGETSAEKANCGFLATGEAIVFCAAATDGCCAAGGFKASAEPSQPAPTTAAAPSITALLPPVSSPAAQAQTASQTPATSQNSTSASGGMSTMNMIYIGAGGGVALLVIIIVAVCCCRGKKKTKDDDMYGKDAYNKHMNDMGSVPISPPMSTGGPNKRFSAQRVQPAPLGNGNRDDRDRDMYEGRIPGGPNGSRNGPPGGGFGGSQRAAGGAPMPKNMHTALFNFTPQQRDELATLQGDKVLVKQEFDDGWGFGKNIRTGKEGIFPLDLLDSFADPFNAETNSPPKGGFKNRTSSLYGAIPPPTPSTPKSAGGGFKSPMNALAPPLPVPTLKADPAGVRKAVYDYVPEMPDEIEIYVGDKIQVKHEFDDGWAVGISLRTGKEGLFPTDVLAGSSSPSQQQQSKTHNQRASSLYDAPALISVSAVEPPDVHEVVTEFLPQMPDELALQIGDKVKLKTQYDDGWAFGQSWTSKEEGLFPLECLAAFNKLQGAEAAEKKFKQRASSLMDVPPMAFAPPTKNMDGNHTVTSDFDPQMQDEIELRVGDKVKLLKEYDDGWATGRNLTTNAEGLLPLDCLTGFDLSVQVDEKGQKKNKARASSIYGAGVNSVYGTDSVHGIESMYGAPTPTVAAPAPASGEDKDGNYVVTSDFDPQMQDEIELRVSDKVKLLKEYDDGWGTGRNLTTNAEGLLPLDCLSGFDRSVQVDDKGKKQNKARASSIYGAGMTSLYGSESVYKTESMYGRTVGLVAAVVSVGKDKDGFYTVTSDFDPQIQDEIELRVGDKVKLIKEYDDGWGTGLNTATNVEGLLPLDCLAGFDGSVQVDEKGKKQNKARASSVYGAGVNSMYGTESMYGVPVPAPVAASSSRGTDKDGFYTVTSDFDPQMQDEIELRIGDKIKLIKEYDDGWGTGRNTATNVEGLFPLDCLSGFDGSVHVDEKGNKRNKARTSSIYGAVVNSMYGAESVYGTESVYEALAPAAASTSAVGNDKDGFYTVTSDFDPEMQDEIELRVGDKVKLIKEYDDGWGTGLNTATKMEGLVPLDCLFGFDGSIQIDEKGKKKYKARASSIYGAGTDSMYASADIGAGQTAIYDFRPDASDEMELRVGDRVQILEQFDDGWAIGKNLSTGREGLFPIDCLPGADVEVDEKGQKKNKQRVSSMYGVGGQESMYNGPATSAVSAGSFQVAVFDFEPQQSDELKVAAGDKIQVLEKFDDGWAIGKNQTSKKEGLFPVDVLPMENNQGQKSSQRMSSLYGGYSY